MAGRPYDDLTAVRTEHIDSTVDVVDKPVRFAAGLAEADGCAHLHFHVVPRMRRTNTKPPFGATDAERVAQNDAGR